MAAKKKVAKKKAGLPKFPATKTDMHQLDFEAQLRKSGLRQIANGAFSRVFSSGAKAKTVVKVGDETDSYMHYVRHVGIENKNPHLPRIFKVQRFYHMKRESYHMWGTGGAITRKLKNVKKYYFAVEMERLIPYDKMKAGERNRAMAAAGVNELYDLCRPAHRLNPKTANAKRFQQVLTKCFKNCQGSVDMHQGNVMFRKVIKGGETTYQFVVTDPLC